MDIREEGGGGGEDGGRWGGQGGGRGGHRQFCPQKVAHVGLSLATEAQQSNHSILPIESLRIRSNTACSRFLQSFALPDKALQLTQKPEHNERFARQYRHEPPPLKLRSPSFKSQHFFSYSNHFHDDGIHRQTHVHTHAKRARGQEGEKRRRARGREEENGGEKGREGKRKEKGKVKSARIHRKRTGASSGTMYHTIVHTSVKHTLCCVHIMYLVCCAGESVCATSHLLYFPCRVAAGYATPAVRHPKRNPKCMCLPSVAKRCMDAKKK